MNGDACPSKLSELITPAIRDVLERYRALEVVPLEAVVRAVEKSLRNPPRASFRKRLIEDGGGSPNCWLCRLPIPLDVPHDAPESFSIDHVVPRRDGGSQLGYENLRAAHRLCNAMRELPKRHTRKWEARFDLMTRMRRDLERRSGTAATAP